MNSKVSQPLGRWDKIGGWKTKLDQRETEMADAVTTNSGPIRPAAELKTSLERVVRLRSELPTHLLAGEYRAALEAHFDEVTSALQLELSHCLETAGAMSIRMSGFS